MDKNKQFVITINREVGSGGRSVGRILAERLNVKYYDKALVAGPISRSTTIPAATIRVTINSSSRWTA